MDSKGTPDLINYTMYIQIGYDKVIDGKNNGRENCLPTIYKYSFRKLGFHLQLWQTEEATHS